MTIGKVIRKYRKELGLTQEEMAKRLGVSTPAVNKWEKNNSLPDVSLLAPIARLLGISTDTLLSFRDDLTQEEIDFFTRDLSRRLETEAYCQVFALAKEKIEEYPGCQLLLWNTAQILEFWKLLHPVPNEAEYDAQICLWYRRALESEDAAIKTAAAISLYSFYTRKKDFDKAESYLTYLSEENPNRKIYQALLYTRTGKRDEAYKIYEGLLLSGLNHLRAVLNNLHILYMEDKDSKMAHRLVDIEYRLAHLFEMGRYQEVSPGLELATAEKDVEKTERIMRALVENTDSLMDFTRSDLFRHTPFREIDPDQFSRLKKDILNGFLDKETYGYMQGNPYWEKLRAGASDALPS